MMKKEKNLSWYKWLYQTQKLTQMKKEYHQMDYPSSVMSLSVKDSAIREKIVELIGG